MKTIRLNVRERRSLAIALLAQDTVETALKSGISGEDYRDWVAYIANGEGTKAFEVPDHLVPTVRDWLIHRLWCMMTGHASKQLVSALSTLVHNGDEKGKHNAN